jgi:hypothetical protein
VLGGLVVGGLAVGAGREDREPLLPRTDLPPELGPGAVPGDPRRGETAAGGLAGDGEDVVQRVAVEPGRGLLQVGRVGLEPTTEGL